MYDLVLGCLSIDMNSGDLCDLESTPVRHLPLLKHYRCMIGGILPEFVSYPQHLPALLFVRAIVF